MSTAYERWCAVDQSREQMWGQADSIMRIECDIDEKLLPENLKQVIYNKTDCSPYDLISECGKWIEQDGNVGDYLSRFFFSEDDVWLAYVMARFYTKVWDCDGWINI